LWTGPGPQMAYHGDFAPYNWRQFVEFGSGRLGDWFCHICDGPVWILGLYEPTVIEAEKIDQPTSGIFPAGSIIRFDFPARGSQVPCTLRWHDGGNKPALPADYTLIKADEKSGKRAAPDFGSFWEGGADSWFLDNRSSNPRLCNREKMVAMKAASAFPPAKYPRVPKNGPLHELIRAVSGEGPEPGSNFAYAARLTEVGCLGMLAQRFGGRLEWDARAMRITNRPELNAYVKEPVRPGWEYGEDLWQA
jgi:hypothetical protein